MKYEEGIMLKIICYNDKAVNHDLSSRPFFFFNYSEKFKLKRGARQGDNISHKLFTSCLQYTIINKINWENKGVRIDGEYLFHLIFADDIVLIANSTSKLQEML